MDQDTGPVGGIAHPPPPDPQLRWICAVMDVLAIGLAAFLSGWAALAIGVYIAASRAYSNRNIRLKRYPFIGFLVVVVCQGALVFWITYHTAHLSLSTQVPVTGLLASSLLLAGAYPLTQIYQHQADKADGVTTISMRFGVKGTFWLSGCFFFLAFLTLGLHFALQLEPERFFVLLVFFIPVLLYFVKWQKRVKKNEAAANFHHLMKMNTISAICSIAGFGSLLIWNLFD